MEAQVHQLGQKYMGSKRAGVRDHTDAVFNTNVAQSKDGHHVPVSNFMNAQCMYNLAVPQY